jgi:hypothetical protein
MRSYLAQHKCDSGSFHRSCGPKIPAFEAPARITIRESCSLLPSSRNCVCCIKPPPEAPLGREVALHLSSIQRSLHTCTAAQSRTLQNGAEYTHTGIHERRSNSTARDKQKTPHHSTPHLCSTTPRRTTPTHPPASRSPRRPRSLSPR